MIYIWVDPDFWKGDYRLLSDAARFVQRNQQLVKTAALQIYCSALAFSPRESTLFKQYRLEYEDKMPRIGSSRPMLEPSRPIHEPSSIILDCPRLTRAPYKDPPILVLDSTEPFAFSPNSNHFIAITEQNSFLLWDTHSGSPIGEVTNGGTHFPSGISAFAFSADGLYLAAGMNQGMVYIWNLFMGRKSLQLCTGSGRIRILQFSPCDPVIASYSDSDNVIRIWKTTTGESVCSPLVPRGRTNVLTFSPDGKRIAASSQHKRAIMIWDREGRIVGSWMADREYHWDRILFSNDGRYLAAASDGPMVVLDGTTAEQIHIWDSVQYRLPELFTLDGQLIWMESRHEVCARKIGTEQDILLSAEERAIVQICLSPRGDRLLIARASGPFEFFDSHTLESVENAFLPPPLMGYEHFAISPDWKKVAVYQSLRVYLFDITSESYSYRPIRARQSQHIPDRRDIMDFSPHEDMILTAFDGKTIRLWNTNTFQHIGPGIIPPDGGQITTACFTPSNKIISGSTTGTIHFWDPTTSILLSQYTGHTDSILSAIPSLDGKYIISTAKDCTLRVWSNASQINETLLCSVDTRTTISEDSQWFAFTLDSEVQVWSFTPLMQIGSGPLKRGEWVVSLVFSRDRGHLACAIATRLADFSPAKVTHINLYSIRPCMTAMKLGVPRKALIRSSVPDWRGPPLYFSRDGSFLVCSGLVWDLTCPEPTIWRERELPYSLLDGTVLYWDFDGWIKVVGIDHPILELVPAGSAPWRVHGAKLGLYKGVDNVLVVDCETLLRSLLRERSEE